TWLHSQNSSRRLLELGQTYSRRPIRNALSKHGGARRLATFCGPVSLRPIRSGDDPIDATRTYPDVNEHAWNNQNVASIPCTVHRPLQSRGGIHSSRVPSARSPAAPCATRDIPDSRSLDMRMTASGPNEDTHV